MYRKILVALDHTGADEIMIPQIAAVAKMCGAALILVHVADGWTARNYEKLNLSESEEMRLDRVYLDQLADRLSASGLTVEAVLALGEPPEEILKASISQGCDLIAMTTHGHRFFGDLLHGSTIDYVRHRTKLPLLIFPAR